MDATKILIACDEFKNAVNRVRNLPQLFTAAEVVWSELSTINEGELKALGTKREALTAEINKLTERRDSLKSTVESMETNINQKTAYLEKSLQDRRDAADADYAKAVSDMKKEIESLRSERDKLASSHEQAMGEMLSQKTALQRQIDQLKSQAQAILHA